MSEEPRGERVQKVLAGLGLGSRREIERWIVAGRVRIEGKRAQLGDRIVPGDRIQLDGRNLAGTRPPAKKTSTKSSKSPKATSPGATPQPPAHRHLLYNKPEGEICTRRDPQGRKSVYDRLPALKHQRWVSVGRLDINTSGLLLFTTDGELANRLMHPSAGIEREYAVRVLGDVTDAALERMKKGVTLDDGRYQFSDIQRGRSAEEAANQWFYVVLMQGRNREVRRLWESQGHKISRLKRVRYGTFFIPSKVKVGRYLEIKGKDAKALYDLAGLQDLQDLQDEGPATR